MRGIDLSSTQVHEGHGEAAQASRVRVRAAKVRYLTLGLLGRPEHTLKEPGRVHWHGRGHVPGGVAEARTRAASRLPP